MWIALGLGVPLMIYSILGGPMTVETSLERGAMAIYRHFMCGHYVFCR